MFAKPDASAAAQASVGKDFSIQRACHIIGSQRPSDVSNPFSTEAVTAREREVLHLICAGYSNKEIADLLALAEGTVKNHVSNLLLKLDARDRTRAALKALQQGHLG